MRISDWSSDVCSSDLPARAYLIPTLRAIRGIEPLLRIIASPWSAPAWMKDTGSLIKGRLRTDRYHEFARYLVSYVRQMRKAGVPVGDRKSTRLNSSH